MSSFAIYRLPHATSCTRISQAEGMPQTLLSCHELDGCQGFVLAPFQASPRQPILLIRPDSVEHIRVQAVSSTPLTEANTASQRYTYSADFSACHTQLVSGALRKIVLARSATVCATTPPDPMQLFWQACQRYPRLFIALVALPDGTCWLSATPEILLEGVGNQWRTVALAGTMQLSGDELQSEGEHVTWSTKNIEEQHLVATYIARCLAQQGIDYLETGPRTVRAANLVHLRSDFTFAMPSTCPVGRLLGELHPTPAVCGLPKQAALDFILSHEHCHRQYYSGFMGPLSIAHETHLYVSLRCMQLRDNAMTLYAGGGLLTDSTEAQEWQETEAKMQTMRALFK